MPAPTEAATRKTLIDPALRRAGWDLDDPSQVGIEIPVDGFDPAAWRAARANEEHGMFYLEEQFALTAQRSESLRTQQRVAARQAEHLFQTLLHKAFRGELSEVDASPEVVARY